MYQPFDANILMASVPNTDCWFIPHRLVKKQQMHNFTVFSFFFSCVSDSHFPPALGARV